MTPRPRPSGITRSPRRPAGEPPAAPAARPAVSLWFDALLRVPPHFPGLSGLVGLPDLPDLPDMRNGTGLPGLPDLRDLPGLPWPKLPTLPRQVRTPPVRPMPSCPTPCISPERLSEHFQFRLAKQHGHGARQNAIQPGPGGGSGHLPVPQGHILPLHGQ